MDLRNKFIAVVLLLIFVTSCGHLFRKEVVFVWFDVTGSYEKHREKAIGDFKIGVRNILTTSNFIYLFKNYHLVVGQIGKTAGSDNILFSSDLYSKQWNEIYKILEELEKIEKSVKEESSKYTDICQSYITMEDYIANYIKRKKLKKKPECTVIYYSDMEHTSNKEIPEIEYINKLRGSKFRIIFASMDNKKSRQQAEFIRKIGLDAYTVPSSEMPVSGKSFFESALR
jgi:hypothetical protein